MHWFITRNGSPKSIIFGLRDSSLPNIITEIQLQINPNVLRVMLQFHKDFDLSNLKDIGLDKASLFDLQSKPTLWTDVKLMIIPFHENEKTKIEFILNTLKKIEKVDEIYSYMLDFFDLPNKEELEVKRKIAQKAAGGLFLSTAVPREVGEHIGSFLPEDANALARTNKDASQAAKEVIVPEYIANRPKKIKK